jgi:hypothetical protein
MRIPLLSLRIFDRCRFGASPRRALGAAGVAGAGVAGRPDYPARDWLT